MNNNDSFSLDEILACLSTMGIAHAVTGNGVGRYTFKSLRRIEERGIFYLSRPAAGHASLRNSIVLCSDPDYGGSNNVTIQVADPQLAFYRLMEALIQVNRPPAGIHPTAVVDGASEISPEAYIGPYCVLEKCVVKAGARLHSHVTVMAGSVIEEHVVIEPHSTIGATGVAWVWDPANGCRVIQPQVGTTVIGAGTFLGSDVTVVRGSVNETTTVGAGCVIAHGSKIGHGTQIGEACHFANNVSIAGNVTLGARCFLGSGAVVRPQVRLAADTVVGAGGVVIKHCDEPGRVLMGVPAKPIKDVSEKMTGVPRSFGA